MRTNRSSRSLVLQVFDECQQRAFAGVERDEVEVVEDARLVQGAQLGIAIAAAQYRDGCDGWLRLMVCAMRKAP